MPEMLASIPGAPAAAAWCLVPSVPEEGPWRAPAMPAPPSGGPPFPAPAASSPRWLMPWLGGSAQVA
eukprot:747506-Alexandrium_andersonii.AAC.1